MDPKFLEWLRPLMGSDIRDPFTGVLGEGVQNIVRGMGRSFPLPPPEGIDSAMEWFQGAVRNNNLPQMATDGMDDLMHRASTQGMGGPTRLGSSRLNPANMRGYDVNANASGTMLELIWPLLYAAMMNDPGTKATMGGGTPG